MLNLRDHGTCPWKCFMWVLDRKSNGVAVGEYFNYLNHGKVWIAYPDQLLG